MSGSSGAGGAPADRRDLLWLLLAALVLIGAGLGLRDPWPADEPRFALVARDMVASHDWLFPHVGNDLYADKPPIYFWIQAVLLALTGSMRLSFLLPSVLAALGVVWLTFDLVRRLHGRAAALAAGATLLVTVQFVLVMRSAQIDPTLGLFATLSLYGLCRHLLLGPAWGWYLVGGFFAGLGVVTKGVGFLPLLVLIPWAVMRARRWQGLPQFRLGGRGWLVAPAFVAGTAVWLLPLAIGVALHTTPARVQYLREILLGQTVTRYAAAWHHHEPFWFFLVDVIPGQWLPWTLLAFGLVPRWREDWRQRRATTWVPLAWVGLVLLFFSASSGKRGIYIAPALPAVALAAAPHLVALYARRWVGRASQGLALLLAVAAAGAASTPLFLKPEKLARLTGEAGIQALWPLAACAVVIVVAVFALRRRPVLAWPAALTALALTWGLALAPGMDATRSGADFMRQVGQRVPATTGLGLVAWKEQFLLQATRPVVEFGHRRWREGTQEIYDAVRWLNEAPGRLLLVPRSALGECFGPDQLETVGRSAGEDWVLASPPGAEACAARGEADRGLVYTPPRP